MFARELCQPLQTQSELEAVCGLPSLLESTLRSAASSLAFLRHRNDQLQDLAKKKKIKTLGVSMGQGQEIIARKYMAGATVEGQWVLLQNTHLGLGYLTEVSQLHACRHIALNSLMFMCIETCFNISTCTTYNAACCKHELGPCLPVAFLYVNI